MATVVTAETRATFMLSLLKGAQAESEETAQVGTAVGSIYIIHRPFSMGIFLKTTAPVRAMAELGATAATA